MKSFIDMNGDILLEIAQYLGEGDLLSLAQTCRIVSRVAELYAYWHPHSLSASRAISAFLLADQIGPWTSYSAAAIRETISQKRRFEKTWKSETVYSKMRVRLARPKGKLSVVPNSKWFVDDVPVRNRGSRSITVVDGKTGKMTKPTDILDEDLREAGWQVENITITASSKNPNELLLGVVLASSGGLDPVLVSVFRLAILQDAHGSLVINRAHLRNFSDVPYGDCIKLHDEYIVLERIPVYMTRCISIGHISSGGLWSWDLSTRALRDSWLFEEWYFVCLQNASNFYVISFHLPSLISRHPSIPHFNTLLSEGERLFLPSLFGQPPSDAPDAELPSCSISVAHLDDSGLAPSPGERFTLIVSRPPEYPDLATTIRLSYIISVQPPMDSVASPYGNIARLTPPKDLPNNEEIQPTSGSRMFVYDRGIKRSAAHPRSRQKGVEFLHYWITPNRVMVEVKITDLYGRGWTRSIVWDGDDTRKGAHLVQTEITLWDASIGMILLQRIEDSWNDHVEADYEVLWL